MDLLKAAKGMILHKHQGDLHPIDFHRLEEAIVKENKDYGYRLGLQDGRTAAQWVEMGKPVRHGDLLSAVDDYARGYRDGLQEVTE